MLSFQCTWTSDVSYDIMGRSFKLRLKVFAGIISDALQLGIHFGNCILLHDRAWGIEISPHLCDVACLKRESVVVGSVQSLSNPLRVNGFSFVFILLDFIWGNLECKNISYWTAKKYEIQYEAWQLWNIIQAIYANANANRVPSFQQLSLMTPTGKHRGNRWRPL